MKRRTKWILAGGVLLIAVGATVMLQGGNDKEPKPVELAEVKARPLTQKVNATGKIQPRVQVKISADVSARITKLAVKEGDFVQQGQFLLELDRERTQASVESQEASVRAAQSNAKLAKENMLQAERVLKRSRDLFAKKLESQSELDRAEASYLVEAARYQSALDQVEQSKGLLKQSRDSLHKTLIYAPMSGTVSTLKKELGEIAIGSQFQEDVILIIADLTEMEAKVKVDENDIGDIALGQQAEIEVDAMQGRILAGKVTEIASSAVEPEKGAVQTSQKVEFEVTVAIADEDARLRPGMTASADIITHTRADALSVPIQSVTVRTLEQLEPKPAPEEKAEAGTAQADNSKTDNAATTTEKKNTTSDGKFTAGKDGYVTLVFVARDDVVSARQVKTGIKSEDFIEISAGLVAGEQVVSGSYRMISRELEHGDPITREDPEQKKKRRAEQDGERDER